MNFSVKVPTSRTVSVSVGSTILAFNHKTKRWSKKMVMKIVQTQDRTYFVLSDHTWRPISSFGTGWKLSEGGSV